MAKRIDVVLLLRNVVYSLEFKVGQKYTVENMEQALDYALRLRNFHKASEDMYICPILIATDERKAFLNTLTDGNKTIGLQKTNDKKLADIIAKIDSSYGEDGEFDFNKWFYSSYCPSPSIIEAAVDAFNSVPVSSIARSEAGQEGIDACVASVDEVIEYARREKKKCLCFVTGVPGAGKTLVGLDIAAKHSSTKDELYSVYISGNGPLVKVLQEALARPWHEAGKVKSKAEGLRKASSLIQDAYEFRNHYLNSPEIPFEKILIFDEAQRVWNKEKVNDFYLKRRKGPDTTIPDASEAELAIRFMNRHEDWAVIVCLVGLGQDIHNGEIGVFGWFHALLDRYQDWEAFYSPNLFRDSVTDEAERMAISHFPGSHESTGLHLAVSVRSFRAEKVSAFVDAVVENHPEKASEILSEIKAKYPIYVTRDLSIAKQWAMKMRVGSERIGLIASSAAKDALENGIDVPPHRFFNWPDWFLLNDPTDKASSNSLQYAASEFNIQGLEIDFAIVHWGGDYQYVNGHFVPYVLRRGGWSEVDESKFRDSTPEEKARWIGNAYRVNLTRARQGMIIYVPSGTEDKTSSNFHCYYDGVYEYLTKQIGIPVLEPESLPKTSKSKMMFGPDENLIEKRLAQLKSYYEQDLIDEEEYKERKASVLDSLLE
ncbi:MAG: DUF2075 domain-containing protein [Bacilli bacterium]|nr:DUF2075 domain-containing protein [Bacilli bacterium]